MNEEYTFKVIIAGDGGVGKTTLVSRYIHGSFITRHKMTLGVDIFTKNMVSEDDIKSILSIWDLGGQQRFHFFLDNFTKGVDGVLYCFDLNRVDSFEKLWWWRDIIRRHAEDRVPSILLGTKQDLVEKTQIPDDLIKEYMLKHKIIEYFETSAKTGMNIEFAFIRLNESMIRHTKNKNKSEVEKDIDEIARNSNLTKDEVREKYKSRLKKALF
jgi:small GTP-binding protein